MSDIYIGVKTIYFKTILCSLLFCCVIYRYMIDFVIYRLVQLLTESNRSKWKFLILKGSNSVFLTPGSRVEIGADVYLHSKTSYIAINIMMSVVPMFIRCSNRPGRACDLDTASNYKKTTWSIGISQATMHVILCIYTQVHIVLSQSRDVFQPPLPLQRSVMCGSMCRMVYIWLVDSVASKTVAHVCLTDTL